MLSVRHLIIIDSSIFKVTKLLYLLVLDLHFLIILIVIFIIVVSKISIICFDTLECMKCSWHLFLLIDISLVPLILALVRVSFAILLDEALRNFLIQWSFHHWCILEIKALAYSASVSRLLKHWMMLEILQSIGWLSRWYWEKLRRRALRSLWHLW